MEILLIAKKSVRSVAAILEIGLILRISGGIPAVSSSDQHNGKPVLGGNPHNSLVSVDEPVPALRELGTQKPLASHIHQFIVRPAEAHHDGLAQNSLLGFFSPEALSRDVFYLHLAVNQGLFGVILKICSVYKHGILLM